MPKRQIHACAVALVFGLLSFAFVLPVQAEDVNGDWQPSRPKQSLSSKRVSSDKSKPGWSASKRLDDTSSHLPWGVMPKRTSSATKGEPKKQAKTKPVNQRDMPRRVKLKSFKSQPTLGSVMPKYSVPATPAPPAPKVAISTKQSSLPRSLAETKPVAQTKPVANGPQLDLVAKERQLTQRELELAKKELALTKQQLDLARKTVKPKEQQLRPAREKSQQSVRQAQHFDELRIPLVTNLSGRSPAGNETSLPTQKRVAFNAPSPRDLSAGSQRPTKTAQRFQFKDISPETRTKPVQGSRFEDPLFGDDPTPADDEPLGFDLEDLAPTTNDDEPSFDTGEAAPSDVNQENIFSPSPSQPSELPSSDLPPAPTSELPTPEPPRSSPLDNVAPSDSLDEDPANLRKRLREELKALQDLPNLGGVPDRKTDEPSDAGVDSDIFSDKKPPEEGDKKGEFSATNGRDCEQEAESCRTDLNYLKRQERISNVSLNITPSLTPAEVDMAAAEETRLEKIAEAPLRTWRDRAGNVIADGNLEDYRHDKVVIRTVNGSFRYVPTSKLSELDRCFVNAVWNIPSECNFESERYEMRDFRLTTFTWVAANTCHKSLYFEQVGVERYGHSSGPIIQPIVSGAHFFGDIALLPYHVGIHPPNECVYTLGHYRPGECAPWLLPGFPVAKRGFTWQGLALGAAIALVP